MPRPYNLARRRAAIRSSGGAVIQETDTRRLGQVAAQYLGRLQAGQRELAASEINRFVRHVGAERPVTQITKLEVERYQQYLADTAGDAATRVEALKTFLSDLKSKKLTETNLGAGLQIGRAHV